MSTVSRLHTLGAVNICAELHGNLINNGIGMATNIDTNFTVVVTSSDRNAI